MNIFNSSFNCLKHNQLFQFQSLWKMLPVNGFGNLQYREFLKKFSGEQKGLEKVAKSLPGSARSTLERPASLRRPKTAPCTFTHSMVQCITCFICWYWLFPLSKCLQCHLYLTAISLRAASEALHGGQEVHATAELWGCGDEGAFQDPGLLEAHPEEMQAGGPWQNRGDRCGYIPGYVWGLISFHLSVTAHFNHKIQGSHSHKKHFADSSEWFIIEL